MVKEIGGGSLYDVGCYSINTLRYILNNEPIEVHAFGNIDPISNVDLSAYVHMKLENGVTALIDCSFDMTERNEYEIVGTKGTIKVPYAFRPIEMEELGLMY